MTSDPATPASPPPAIEATAAVPAPAGRRNDGGYRDTIESILIAFILAFVFRAFVVEAFVIPTGSMAPTLLGAHARFTCPDCGYQFQSNFSPPREDQDIPAAVDHSKFRNTDCPNCGHQVHNGGTGGEPVPVHYGDRILVLKYAYLFNEPQRWDVVVFKSPDMPLGADSDPSGPAPPGKTWYTTNFIKRLVGRPGESLMVLDGDIYVSPNGGASLSDFKVQSKPRHVQDALWRIVYDGDFVPREESWHPWRVESGTAWDIGSDEDRKRVYTFDSSHGGAGTIEFDQNFNNDRAFTDSLAYAQAESGREHVSDIKLSLLYHRKAGDGPLRLRMKKLDDTFTAELRPGVAKLFRKTGTPANADDLGEEIGSASNVAALARSGAIQLDFMNVDYGVTLRVGDVDVLHASYEPDIAALKLASDTRRKSPKPEVRIAAGDQACELSHLSIWRDVYYTNRDPNRGYDYLPNASPELPVKLGPDEFFVMGDNTVISADARYWGTPIHLPAEDLDVQAGRVPRRFMLGKAFFVYWPAGYRPLGSNNLPGLIPNFGDMRFIH